MKLTKYLILLFILSLILRLGYTFIPQLDYFHEKNPVSFTADIQYSDGGSYILIAKGFLKYGYPSRGELDGKLFMAGGFLYPLILAGNIYFSNNLSPIIFLQILLDSLIPVLLFVLAFKFTNKKLIALLVSLGYSFYYPNYLYARNIGPDSLYIFFLFLSVFWFLYKINELKIIDYIIIGGLFSITSLIRAPIYFPFLFTSLIFLFICLFFKHKFNLRILSAICVFFIVQLPMLYISYKASGNFIAGSTGGNVVLMIGTYLPANGDNDAVYLKIFPNHPQNLIDSAAIKNNWSQIQKDSAYSVYSKNQLFDNFSNHTLQSIKVMSYQLTRFWFNFPFYNPASKGTFVIAFYNGILLLLAITGMISALNINKSFFAVLTVLIMYQGLHLLVFNTIRYSAPLIPFVFFFIAFGLDYLLTKKNIQYAKLQ